MLVTRDGDYPAYCRQDRSPPGSGTKANLHQDCDEAGAKTAKIFLIPAFDVKRPSLLGDDPASANARTPANQFHLTVTGLGHAHPRVMGSLLIRRNHWFIFQMY